MNYPKWKYRKHPDLGIFQATLVASEKAEKLLDKGWSDDPTATGFRVRPASHIHASHIVEGVQLHEVVTDKSGAPIAAAIHVTTTGDIQNA